MSDMTNWEERCWEQLNSDPTGYMDESASRDFWTYAEETLGTRLFDMLISGWLQTPEGKKWHEEAFEALCNDRPEMEPENEVGADR